MKGVHGLGMKKLCIDNCKSVNKKMLRDGEELYKRIDVYVDLENNLKYNEKRYLEATWYAIVHCDFIR